MGNNLKKIIVLVGCFAAAFGCMFSLTACVHQHSFSKTYNRNESYHWKICTSKENCDEIIEYEKHSFGIWQTKTPKTCTSNEIEYRVCICGIEETRDGDIASHNPSSTLSFNTEQHWNACLDCAELLNKNNHNMSEWKMQYQATCTTPEVQYSMCNCGYTETRNVGSASHLPVINFSYDTDYHWNNCNNCTDKLNITAHSMQDGICSLCKYGTVAVIGTTHYTSLQQAVDSITDNTTPTTIVLFDNISGGGVKVPENSNIIFDLNGFTYTVVQPAVGSKGTTTSGFQLLKNSTIVFKNGAITHATKYTVEQDTNDVQILIQNYSNLTLENVSVDARSKMADAQGTCLYALSNNYGNVTIKGNTNIIADVEREGTNSGGVAFDLWYTSGTYKTGVNVTFDASFKGSITGKIEYGSSTKNLNWETLACLTINGGTFNTGDFIFNEKVVSANIVITGGTFNFDVSSYLAEDYKCELIDGKYIVTEK